MCDRRAVAGFEKGYRIEYNLIVYTKTGRPRKLHLNGGGYPQCCIRDTSGRLVHLLAHKLAAYQKYGEKALQPSIVVRHRDDNPLNFRLSNILIGTQSQNCRDKWRNREKCLA